MIPCVGVASGIGGSNCGSKEGPIVIREKVSLPVDWKEIYFSNPDAQDIWQEIPALNKKLAQTTHALAMHTPLLLVITGDHSSAMGTWSGIAEAERKKGGELGLIWMDAHMDSHTPETSPSGNVHGMPLAALLGYGPSNFTKILSDNQKIKPENLFIVGARSFEDEERELLERLKVRIYYVDEVKKRGQHAVLDEILQTFSKAELNYGISLDIDFFDPLKMPATGSPVENGLDPEEFLGACQLFESYPPVAFEFVEFNPSLDIHNISLDHITKILTRVVQTPMSSLLLAAALEE